MGTVEPAEVVPQDLEDVSEELLEAARRQLKTDTTKRNWR
jgi:hypothetical protein